MGESKAESSNNRFEVGIPYFFYDVIGRILPGAFLIVGSILSWNGPKPFVDAWTLGKGSTIETGAATLILGVGTLAFIGLATLVGSMIASLAFILIHKSGLLEKSTLSLNGLCEFMGVRRLKPLEARFADQFGTSLIDKPSMLNGASHLCSYHLFSVSPNLAVLSARHDAELLASQSMVLIVAILIPVTLRQIIFVPNARHFGAIWLSILLVSLVGFWLTFAYHRRKRLYSRFALYLVSPLTNKGEMPKPDESDSR